MTREEAWQGLQGYSLLIADGTDLKEALNMAIEALRREDCDESCEDCPLYDKERHSCPRFNKVIPRTIAEAVQGEWRRVETRTYKGECTNCGFRHVFIDGHDSQYRFCPNCGARMYKGGDDKEDEVTSMLPCEIRCEYPMQRAGKEVIYWLKYKLQQFADNLGEGEER